MDIASAVKLVNALIFEPGWKISASDYSHRFEGAVAVRIDYPTRQANRDQADDSYPLEVDANATFPVVVVDCMDDTALYRRVIDQIIKIKVHETREFLRVRPTNWAPFHPHKIDGMRRWGNLEDDLNFGIVG